MSSSCSVLSLRRQFAKGRTNCLGVGAAPHTPRLILVGLPLPPPRPPGWGAAGPQTTHGRGRRPPGLSTLETLDLVWNSSSALLLKRAPANQARTYPRLKRTLNGIRAKQSQVYPCLCKTLDLEGGSSKPGPGLSMFEETLYPGGDSGKPGPGLSTFKTI